MSEKRRFICLAVIMAVLVPVTDTVAYVGLNNTALAEAHAPLVETYRSQARLIKAVASDDSSLTEVIMPHRSNYKPRSATLSQIFDAHVHCEDFGKTVEFTLAWLAGDTIRFLLSHRHCDPDQPTPVAGNTALAEPMRRAVTGLLGYNKLVLSIGMK